MTSKKSENLIYTAATAWNHRTFLESCSVFRNAQLLPCQYWDLNNEQLIYFMTILISMFLYTSVFTNIVKDQQRAYLSTVLRLI